MDENCKGVEIFVIHVENRLPHRLRYLYNLGRCVRVLPGKHHELSLDVQRLL